MRSCLFLLASACIAGLVHAQTPQPVTIVVPFSAGSAQDVFTRLISDRLAQELRAPVLIINKAGAGGTLGAAFVAHAKPDGKTYLLASSSHHLAGALHPRLSYHPLDSFRGAAFLGMTEFVLIVSETMKTSDLATFVARVQSQPNEFNYASAGSGSVTHAGMASFLNKAGLQMVHIPLKGTGEIIQEVLAGRVQAAMVCVFSIQAYKADPRVQLLATTFNERTDTLVQLPTVAESGYPQYSWVAWTGLIAPSGTPTEKIDNMNSAIAQVFRDPVMQARFKASGIAPSALSIPQFDKLLHKDWAQSSAVIERFKLTLD
jgi:tripartite-type tricarboxylate transporter receptor subunit TctC